MHTTYLDNCIVPACFSALIRAISCILFFSLFSQPFSGLAVFSSALLFIQPVFALSTCTSGILICNLHLLVLATMLSQKFSHHLYLLSVIFL